jgi:outer membrane protein assembly factor BamB
MASVFLLICATTVSSQDWPKYRADLANTGRSGQTGITSSNVNSLQMKWKFNTGGIVSASPAVATIGGRTMVFVGDWKGIFHALDAKTGKEVWSFQIDLIPRSSGKYLRIASSPAVSDGLVYFGAANGFFYALDAESGYERWSVQVGDPNEGYEIWSSPAVWGGTVYFGLASHGDTPCVAGRVQARNAVTGALNWEFNTIDPSSCPYHTCVGAGVWTSPAIDTYYGIVYVGTGNPGSTCKPSTSNAHRYPDSILALDTTSGALLNYVQVISNDHSDNDFGASPVLHSTSIINTCTGEEAQSDWVSEGSKNGIFYTFQRGAIGFKRDTAPIHRLLAGQLIASPAAANVIQHPDPCTQLHGSTFYVPTVTGNLYSISQSDTGAIAIKTKLAVPNSGLYSAPAIVGDLVFFGGSGPTFACKGDKSLHAVRRDTLAPVYQFPTQGCVTSGPAISHNRIYFASWDGNVYCLSVNGK